MAILVLASAVWLIGKPWSRQSDAQKPPSKSSYLTSLENKAVAESSGIAPSLIRNGVYWTHNDSNAGAEIFAFDEQGKDLGSFTLKGVDARDWEDMASRKLEGTSYLYVGDIGDNLEDQKTVRIYRFREPAAKDDATISGFEKYTVSFPDGPKNAETLMVGPKGDIYIVTKNSKGNSGVYKLPKPEGTGNYKLKKVADIKIEGGNSYSLQITGGDMSPDGTRVVLRTYFSVLLFEVQDIKDIAARKPTSLPVPLERQGEAICFDVDKDRLLTTSEGSPCRVSTISLP